MSLEPQENLQTPSHYRSEVPLWDLPEQRAVPRALWFVLSQAPWEGPGLAFWPSVRTAVEGETECHSASEELVTCPWQGLGRPPADLCLLLPRAGRYHGLRAGVGT